MEFTFGGVLVSWFRSRFKIVLGTCKEIQRDTRKRKFLIRTRTNQARADRATRH